jgi:hypothetical protein
MNNSSRKIKLLITKSVKKQHTAKYSLKTCYIYDLVENLPSLKRHRNNWRSSRHLFQPQKRTVNFPVADEKLQMNVWAVQKEFLLPLKI